MLSQKLSTSDTQSRPITTVQRDSIFIKIQRGKSDAAKVKTLKKAVAACDETKKTYIQVIETQKMKADSLLLIIDKQEIMAGNVEDINKALLKDQKKKTTKAFFKGGFVGILLTVVTATAIILF